MNTKILLKLFDAIFCIVLCVSCANKSKGYSGIGKYVYIDDAGILHTKIKCDGIYKEKSAQMVTPVLVNRLTHEQLQSICSRCVTEVQIDSLNWWVGYTNDGYDIDSDIR